MSPFERAAEWLATFALQRWCMLRYGWRTSWARNRFAKAYASTHDVGVFVIRWAHTFSMKTFRVMAVECRHKLANTHSNCESEPEKQNAADSMGMRTWNGIGLKLFSESIFKHSQKEDATYIFGSTENQFEIKNYFKYFQINALTFRIDGKNLALCPLGVLIIRTHAKTSNDVVVEQ